MKKLHIVLFVFSLAAISCKSKKEITKIQDSTEVSIPFSGKQFENNKNFFRAKQVGESTDLATAKKIAEQKQTKPKHKKGLGMIYCLFRMEQIVDEIDVAIW